jgi:ActR/RegA family two-component response regulator
MSLPRNLSILAENTDAAGVVTTATNAINTGVTAASSGATNYLTFVTATTGNLPQLVNSSITANAANGTITGGIAGGAF